MIGLATVLYGAAAPIAFAGDDSKFLAALREPVVLVKYAAPQPVQREPLTVEDQSRLLGAKQAMADFLKSFSTFSPDPLTFLAPAFRTQFRSGQDLYAKKFGAEKLLQVEVYDYALPDKSEGTLALYVVLTDTTEGIDTRQPTAFSFSESDDGRWLIVGIGREVGFR